MSGRKIRLGMEWNSQSSLVRNFILCSQSISFPGLVPFLCLAMFCSHTTCGLPSSERSFNSVHTCVKV